MGPGEMLTSDELPFKKIINDIKDITEGQLLADMIFKKNLITIKINCAGVGKVYQKILDHIKKQDNEE